MTYRKLFTIILCVLVALQLMPVSAEGQVTITLLSNNLSLTNRLLVPIPVSVVCDPLPDPPVKNSVSVYLEQTTGKKTNKGSAFARSLEGSPLFICDGTTPNLVTVNLFPDADSGPFHNGAATISITADYWSGISLGGGGFWITGSEYGETGPIAVRLR